MNPLYHHTFAPWRADGDRRIVADEAEWAKWIEIDRQAKADGQRQRVMVTCEVFEEFTGWMELQNGDIAGIEVAGGGMMRADMDDARMRIYSVIEATPNLDWLIISESPSKIDNIVRRCRLPELRNLWLGTLIRTQAEADERIPHLLSVPAAVRFALCEPREGIDFSEWMYTIRVEHNGDGDTEEVPCKPPISLLVCRGETGTDARPMHWRHAHSLRDQCENADVPFRFDGWGEWVSGVKAPLDIAKGATSYKPGAYHDFGDDSMALKVGSAHSGRLLDGKTHDGLPEVAR
jgi:hypothetical protein